MDWNWIGKEGEDDKSGILMFQFGLDHVRIAMPSFIEALRLMQSIDRIIVSSERRGEERAIDNFKKKIAEQIRQSY